MPRIDEHATPGSLCPHCGYFCDRATGTIGKGHRAPRPGDLSMCLSCGEMSVFTINMRLEKAPVAVMTTIPKNQKVLIDRMRFVRSVVVGNTIAHRERKRNA